MVDAALFSNATNGGKDTWATPDQFYQAAELFFGRCDLDVCASTDNAKCRNYFTEADDGLKQPWHRIAKQNCWMNPPYSNIKSWMAKALIESRLGASVICLVPARTDTDWWHRYAQKADRILFLRGRIKFSGGRHCAPFPSALLYFVGEPPRVGGGSGVIPEPAEAVSGLASRHPEQSQK